MLNKSGTLEEEVWVEMCATEDNFKFAWSKMWYETIWELLDVRSHILGEYGIEKFDRVYICLLHDECKIILVLYQQFEM